LVHVIPEAFRVLLLLLLLLLTSECWVLPL
jgi:hypothetical protein